MNKKWDYKTESNQNLLSKIDKLTENKFSKLVIPLKFQSLFESLEKYEKDIQKLDECHDCEFVQTRNNIIYINLINKLEVLNFI